MNDADKLLKQVESIRTEIIVYLINHPTVFDESDEILFAYKSEETVLKELTGDMIITERGSHFLDILNIDELYQLLSLVKSKQPNV